MSTGKMVIDGLNTDACVFGAMQLKRGLLLELSESDIQEDVNLHA
jgi:hypothetical protein